MVHATVERKSLDSFTVTFGDVTPLNNKRVVSVPEVSKSVAVPAAANASSNPVASVAKSTSAKPATSASKSIAASRSGTATSASGTVVASETGPPNASPSKISVVDAASPKDAKEAAVTKARAAVVAADKVIGEIFTKIKGKTMEGLTENEKKKEGMRRLKDEIGKLKATAMAALTAATEAEQAIPSDVTKRMITFATAMGNSVDDINNSTIDTGKSGTLLSNFKKATIEFNRVISVFSTTNGGRRTRSKHTRRNHTHRTKRNRTHRTHRKHTHRNRTRSRK